MQIDKTITCSNDGFGDLNVLGVGDMNTISVRTIRGGCYHDIRDLNVGAFLDRNLNLLRISHPQIIHSQILRVVESKSLHINNVFMSNMIKQAFKKNIIYVLTYRWGFCCACLHKKNTENVRILQ